jgi:glycosyltransferase involved in cell wall biosynthesis
MKLAIFTDGIHPCVVGGIQRHTFYLTKFLAAKGVEIDLYHFLEPGGAKENDLLNLFTQEEKQRVNSIVLPYPGYSRLPGHHVREAYRFSVDIYKHFLTRPFPDFVYAKSYSGWKYIQEKQKGADLPPIGVKLHGYEIFQMRSTFREVLNFWMHRMAAIYNTRNADVVFSYGGKISDIIIDKVHADAQKVIEIPSGVNPSWLEQGLIPEEHGGRKRFVFLGRYEKRKGIEFINRWIKNTDSDFIFRFIGPIPESSRLDDPRVTYDGMITDSDVLKDKLRYEDVLVCPSFAEGMPNVILEGMAMGCAILATDTGATSAMVQEDNGWLIEARNYDKFVETMEHIIQVNEADIIAKKKSSADKALNMFNWETISTRILEEIESRFKGIQ